MKRTRILLSTLFIALVFAAVGMGRGDAPVTQAQDDHLLYLPLIARPLPPPVIHYFRANVAIADPGDTILLEWASSGAVTAQLAQVSRGGPYIAFWDVSPTGVFTFTIDPAEREYVLFSLYAANAAETGASAALTIPLTCPDTWFFSPVPEGCPGAPALFSAGAQQPFEHGYMVWAEEAWADGQAGIYVLYDDDVFSPRWDFHPDTWQEGDPLCDVGPPPADHYQPQRGFGNLWCDEPAVRDRLGWATDPETGYQAAVQRDSAPKYTTLYVRAADYNVWQLLPERSRWEKILTDEGEH